MSRKEVGVRINLVVFVEGAGSEVYEELEEVVRRHYGVDAHGARLWKEGRTEEELVQEAAEVEAEATRYAARPEVRTRLESPDEASEAAFHAAVAEARQVGGGEGS